MTFLVMNLERWLKAIFLPFFLALNLLLRTLFSSAFVHAHTEEGATALGFLHESLPESVTFSGSPI